MHRSFLYPPCLARMWRVHTHSGEFSLNDSLWAPYNHMCALTYAIHRRAVSILPQESPHETATWAETRESWGMVYDPDTQTGLYCPAWHQSLPEPPTLLPFGSPQPVRLGCPTHKHAYKSLVCVAPEEDPAPAQWHSHEQMFWALSILGL